MKKIFSFFTYLFISASLFCACSEDGEYPQNKKNQAESDLIVNLEKLNTEILSNNKKSRGFLNWRTCAIAMADIRGALDGAKAGASLGAKVGMVLGSPHTGAVTFAFIGGCAVGGFDSYVAHQGLKGCRAEITHALDYPTISQICQATISDDLNLVENSIICSPNANNKLKINERVLLEEQYLNIGKIHNVILSVAEGEATINADKCTANPTITKILESTEFRNMYNDITYKKLNNIEITRDPLEEKVINLFCEVFKQYSANCSDVAYIINKYIDILEKSKELSDIQLNSIKTGLAISLYSFNYWDQTPY